MSSVKGRGFISQLRRSDIIVKLLTGTKLNLNIKVAVRVRPFNKRELDNDAVKIIEMGDQTTSIKNPRVPDDTKSFTYDYSYCSFDPAAVYFANQNIVYKGTCASSLVSNTP